MPNQHLFDPALPGRSANQRTASSSAFPKELGPRGLPDGFDINITCQGVVKARSDHLALEAGNRAG
jgi:hypothetical protein